MNILATQFTLEHNSLDIYLAGCSGSPHCIGCHNPESWDFNKGKEYDLEYKKQIKDKVIMFDDMIKNIMIFGGEPLDQNHRELFNLLNDLKELNKNIWLFTRYDLAEIPIEIVSLCNYIKTGRYLPDLKCDDNIQYRIKLATSNQKIIKLKGDINND